MKTLSPIPLALGLIFVTAAAAAEGPPAATSLNTCQSAVRTAAAKFIKLRMVAVSSCLQAVSRDIIKKDGDISTATAKLCAKRFRQIHDSRGHGVSLEEKKVTAISKKCVPGMPRVTHNLNDITGNAGGNAPSPGIGTSSIRNLCGSIETLDDWIDCIDRTHECAADLAIASEYPRALEWFALLKAAITDLPVPAKDPSRNIDALIGLQQVNDQIDGVPLDGKPDIVCGPSPAASLSGLRWELPCIAPTTDARVCTTNASDTKSTVFGGAPGAQYDIELRFRGVVETKAYSGGATDGFLNVGGTPAGDAWNVYRLSISAPAQTLYLNAGTSGLFHSFGIDYTRTVRAASGATVTLTSLSIDNLEIVNRDDGGNPIVVPNVPPAPSPYDGQFVQMDVVSVTRVP